MSRWNHLAKIQILGKLKGYFWKIGEKIPYGPGFLEEISFEAVAFIKEVSFVATMTVQLGHNFKVTKPLPIAQEGKVNAAAEW